MKKAILIISVLAALASGSGVRTVRGIITDSQGRPLPGASVVVKGNPTVGLTDKYGAFSITVPEGEVILIFHCTGYEQKELMITSSEPLLVQLDKAKEPGKDKTVQGQTQNRKPVDASPAPEIKADELKRASLAPTASRAYDMTSVACFQPAPGFNTEGYSAIHENGFRSPLREPLSTFSIDVDAASYSNVRRFIMQGQRPVQDAVRVEEMINYFDYEYPQPNDGHPFAIFHELGECPWNRDNMLLHIGLQGEKFSHEEVPPSNLVFLLDVSGSMNAPNKLPLLIQAMKLLVGQLREADRVAIVVYAGISGLILPSTPGNQKEKIICALNQLRAGGSTAGAAGLKLAYQVAEQNFICEGNNRIILATDGDFNVGPSSNAEMERMIETYRNKGIFISVAGFGMGNYKDDKMEIIADKGNGNYAYIDNLMEAKKVFISEFSSTLYTIAKDVKIQIEFNPAFVKEYRLVGYENRLLNEEDFEDDIKDAGELGAGHTVTALYEIVPARCSDELQRRLKYQQSEILPDASASHEMATIKFRYKKSDGDKSILMTQIIPYETRPAGLTSENFRFSAAVAGFGMLLRNSEYKGSMTADKVLSLARGSRGRDEDGYRAEFIRLVELSENGLAMGSNE